MSLTHSEWLEMWKAIKILERSTVGNDQAGSEEREAIDLIKKKIQSVVGQLE